MLFNILKFPDLSFENPAYATGHRPRLGRGTVFVWGGTSSHLRGHGPGMYPVALGLVQNCRDKSTVLRIKFLSATSPETSQIKPPEIKFSEITPLLEPPKLNLTKNKYFNGFS